MNIKNIGHTSTSKDVVSLREASIMLGHKSTDMTKILAEQGHLKLVNGETKWFTSDSLMSYINHRYDSYISDSVSLFEKTNCRD